MSWILALLSSFWKPIAALGGGLLVFFFQRWKIHRQAETISDQNQAIKIHEAKEEAHNHDNNNDIAVEQKIKQMENKLADAPNQEEAANEMGKTLNDYFNPDN